MKNPVRLESPMEYTDYLNETFDEGGCAIMLLANTSILHWIGIDRASRSRFWLMDPALGGYFPFASMSTPIVSNMGARPHSSSSAL